MNLQITYLIKLNKMTIFNLESKCFEIYNNQAYFLTIQIDREIKHLTEITEIIHLFDIRTTNKIIIALNNEDDLDLERCLEMFSNENINFLMLLDFYRYDNQNLLKELI